MNIQVNEELSPLSAGRALTKQLQSLIDHCEAAGGGTLHFAAGEYLTGTLRLKSNVSLHLSASAVLKGCRDVDAYPILREKPFGEKPGVIRCLIYAENAENISIGGCGCIDGGFPEGLDLEAAKTQTFRPELIFFKDCHNIRITEVMLRDSGFWCLHLMHCIKVRLNGLTIRTSMARINTDGIDPDGCRDVIISDCDIETGDDCIVLKSTEGQACENILISNCILRTHHGGIKIGTEALGPIRNITVSNCILPKVANRKNGSVGIAMYMKDGSCYENMNFSQIIMEGMHHLAVMVDNRPRYHQTDKAGVIRNINFNGLIISGGGRMLFEGREDAPINGLSLNNINWTLDQYGLSFNKPLGSARTDHCPKLPAYLDKPFHVIVANVRQLAINSLSLNESRTGSAPDRGLVYLHNVTHSHPPSITTDLKTEGYEKLTTDNSLTV